MPLHKARFKISDYNRTRKYKLNKQERRVRMVSLSLTSMVDMFAILVIFLLTNTSSVSQWVEVGHGIQLPKSKFSDPPPKAATLQISAAGVFGDRTLLSGIADLQRGGGEPVRAWLSHLSKKDGYINVVAHEKLPFKVIRRIISICQDSGFKNVNLAVQPKT